MVVDQIISELKGGFTKSLERYKESLKKVQAGRATADLVEDLMVDSYGSPMALKSLSTISIPDSSTIFVSPWDKSNLSNIEKAVLKADLGLGIKNDGEMIILKMSPMTEEKRTEVIKKIHAMMEEAKISIRNIRHDALKKIKNAKNNDEISEDEQKKGEKDVQKETEQANDDLGEITEKKENSVKNIS